MLSRFTRFDNVIVLIPHFFRVLYPRSESKHSFFYYNFLHDYKMPDTYLEVMRNKIYDLFDEGMLLQRLLSSVESMINCAKMNGTNIYFSSWDPDTYNFVKKTFGDRTNILPPYKAVDVYFGRDGSHPGKQVNHKVADLFTESLRSYGV